jgi:hypothetical protein
VGSDSHPDLYPFLGLGVNSQMAVGYNGIETVNGIDSNLMAGYSFNYLYGSNADYGIDELDIGDGIALMESQDENIRAVSYNSGLYRTITASAFFGAIADGTGINTKTNMMLQYLNFFTTVNTENIEIPLFTQLGSNYPNPFNPTTTISFSNPEESKIEITIYNSKGQKIKTLVNEVLSAGEHTVMWDGTDNRDTSVSSGIYFYKMKTYNYTSIKKMILLK